MWDICRRGDFNYWHGAFDRTETSLCLYYDLHVSILASDCVMHKSLLDCVCNATTLVTLNNSRPIKILFAAHHDIPLLPFLHLYLVLLYSLLPHSFSLSAYLIFPFTFSSSSQSQTRIHTHIEWLMGWQAKSVIKHLSSPIGWRSGELTTLHYMTWREADETYSVK